MFNMTRHTLVNAVAYLINTTNYSDVLDVERSSGSAAVEITSSAGSITVTQQCSFDGLRWFDPVDASGNALGAVVSTMTVGSKYIVPSTVVTKFLRFKIVENNSAATTVTLKYGFQESND